jgi:colanic acid/amylovoran biosynthesis glycosyltransferase
MRIAFFVGIFPLPSETFILRQATGLKDLGQEVDIIADYRPPDDTPIHSDVNRYGLLDTATYMDMPLGSAYELPVWPPWEKTWVPGASEPILNMARVVQAMPTLVRSVVAHPRLTIDALRPSEFDYQAASLSTLYRLVNLTSKPVRYDILHGQFGTVANSFRFAKQLWKSPLVVSFRGHDYSRWPREHGRDVYRELFHVADAVTVNTEFARLRVEELGCPSQKIHKLPSSIELAEFPFHDRVLREGEAVRILSVGRLVEMKGMEYAVRAIGKVREAVPNLAFDIIGDGPLRGDLEKLRADLGLEGIVTFHGAQEIDDVRRLIDRAHIFLLASVTAANGDEESLGNVLIEAQASGLPVVATNHNGFPETVAPENARFLVSERNPDALAKALISLIEHREAWPPIAARGRAHVERHYNAQRNTRRLLELYERLVAEAADCRSGE